ncbi:MAG: FAD-dependent oxidoreductase, partial [Rikenellaceae bacterium]|nr:FAD-dependent oxidoreductase [Rikenellaceae bacterium]
MNKECDFLIVGSGAAGLVTALKAAEHGHVIVVTKSDMSTTNTAEAQGGIASVTYPPDNFDKHIRDTMTCGSNECDPEAVRIVVEGAPDR